MDSAEQPQPIEITGETQAGTQTGTQADASPLLAFDAPDSAASGLLGVLLEIAGEEGRSLHWALAAWQREQDRLANRAWRRPGGMARPAGL